MKNRLALLFWLFLITLALGGLYAPPGGLPPFGALLDPLDGLYRTARQAARPFEGTITIPALEHPVTVVRDERGVPHIFAASDRDAVVAHGYVTAQDRLFQLDFIPRVASGRLSEAFGPAALESDRFLRRTGMEWGAQRALRELEAQGGIEYDLLRWYAEGVNAYLDGLDAADLPFEFRLLGYRPDRYGPLQTIRLLQFMNYDLSWRTDDPGYAALQAEMDPADYARLYPRYATLYRPIVPSSPERAMEEGAAAPWPPHVRAAVATLNRMEAQRKRLAGSLGEGFIEGKGSNNWAVNGARSATGAPILAGDMHLALTLPAIWYEVHLVTPTMNTYGVAVPGAPLPVEAFNDHVGWAFTNTGSDQIDHYALDLDSTRTRYRYEGAWRDLEVVLDTIRVKGGASVVDTLYYAHFGPVTMDAHGAVAIRWTAHTPGHTLGALWGMNHARDLASFEEAIRQWDTPMQNILYAGVDGHIAIRSTGYLPIRRGGHGAGLLDGTTGAFEWVGRVPFEELPHAVDPARGYLTSTNQQPAGPEYPYYLGHDWRAAYRSLRIDELLRSKAAHRVEDLMAYQADVHAVQRDLFVPLLDTLRALPPRTDSLRAMLAAWDGDTGVDRSQPLVLDVFLDHLRRLAWDEPVFAGRRTPAETRLYLLLTEDPGSPWLDVQATPEREDAAGLLRLALDSTAVTLLRDYGRDPAAWRWGDHHHVLFRHLTRSEALQALDRGPFEYPGFDATLSPAAGRVTTHSASWRVVVDFSKQPPVGYGVYPGGQSGNPFSPHYDAFLDSYLSFRHYPLHKPTRPEELQGGTHLVLAPAR
ncbi:MAG: penicillin amidase [Rhodothermaceae bacterium]|nr:MAG: penicillin amidase [Rhodothermaceae bacterium]